MFIIDLAYTFERFILLKNNGGFFPEGIIEANFGFEFFSF